MKSLYDFCVLALGVVFEWSGAMKLISGGKWQVEGTPFATGNQPIDAVIRRWLPLLELVVGTLLVVRVGTVGVAAIALAMLIAFTATLIRVMKSGQRPPCLCFGSSRPRPISWKTLARNVVLIAFAITTIVGA